MAGFSRGVAILISIIIGMVILPILGISGIFSIIIIGFLATYLTVSGQRSYKIGGFAGGVLGFLIFIYGFFVAPQLPDLPNLSGFQMVGLALGGLFNLVLGFILLTAVSAAFGSLGGLIAQKIHQNRSKELSKRSEGYTRNKSQRGFKDKKPRKSRRSLNKK